MKSFEPHWNLHPEYKNTVARLSNQPALVFAGETRKLKSELVKVSDEKAFILNAGECAEMFEYANGKYIHDYVRIMSILRAYLTKKLNLEIVTIGRIAGQYAKPRSNQFEVVNGIKYETFKGEIINGYNLDARQANPKRMIKAYNSASKTLNLIRGFWYGGYNTKEFLSESLSNPLFQQFLENTFYKIKDFDIEMLGASDFFISHEALLLDYEYAFTRIDTTSGKIYNSSAHFLWLGERTRSISSRQVEYLSMISNPIGIKVGPNFDSEELVEIIKRLNPNREKGKIVLIARFGKNKVEKELDRLINHVMKKFSFLSIICDPMHGNTIEKNGFKTRYFNDLLIELENFIQICRDNHIWPGGVQLELTPNSVTECIGGEFGCSENELKNNYQTYVDPRLNGSQSLELMVKTFS